MSNPCTLRRDDANPCADASVTLPGLCTGTVVLTLAGERAIENLNPGDRIITRDGTRVLRAVRHRMQRAATMILVPASALGAQHPERDLLLAPDQQILVRDWQAMALEGVDQPLIRADRLRDAGCIRAETVADQNLFELEFDLPVVIYAGGLELASTSRRTA